jgi:predicted HTH domain antitoxin
MAEAMIGACPRARVVDHWRRCGPDCSEGALAMSIVQLELEDELMALLRQTNEPVQHVVRELIVLELYRRGTISSGKAAELLGMQRFAFVEHASRLGIPYFDMTEDEWKAECEASKRL